MEYGLDNRLQKLIGEHKINLMTPKGLLEITAATLEALRAHLLDTHPEGISTPMDLARVIQLVLSRR